MAYIPQIGNLEEIRIRPIKRGDTVAVKEVFVDPSDGLENDHYSKAGGKRMITLIQKEHLEIMMVWFNKNDVSTLTRRNLIVSGMNLLALHDRQFTIGDDVILEGTGHCHPCNRMETNLGSGGYNAMRGHGGITAKVIHGGIIRTGDRIQIKLEK